MLLIKGALELSSRQILLGIVGITVVTFNPTLSDHVTNIIQALNDLVRTVGMFGWQRLIEY